MAVVAPAVGRGFGAFGRGAAGPEPDVIEGAAVMAVDGGGAAVVGSLGTTDDAGAVLASGTGEDFRSEHGRAEVCWDEGGGEKRVEANIERKGKMEK